LVACFVLELIGVACERARLPRLMGEPLALSAGEDGALCAVSTEARAYGIRPGQASTFARSLCQGLIVLPYDRETYEASAEAVWDAVSIESSTVEPVCPEVVYAWLTGARPFERAQVLALHLGEIAGVDVRVGVGRSKLLAHQAARTGAGDACGREASLLAQVRLEDLSLLPPKVKSRARQLGLRTLGEIVALPAAEMDRQFKEAGLLLRRLGAGEDGDVVKPLWPRPGVEYDIAFDEEVIDASRIHYALGVCASNIAATLNKDRIYCRHLALIVYADRGISLRGEEDLAGPVREPCDVERAALRLLGRMKIERPVTRLSLKAGHLSVGSGAQLTLISQGESGPTFEQNEKLEAAQAHMKEKYGAGAIIPGALLRRAQRIHLWTYHLGQMRNEPVDVVTDEIGDPLRIVRRERGAHSSARPGALYEVRQIQNCWRETDWSWGNLSERVCFRVVTDPAGLYELHRAGTQWLLCGVQD